MFDFAQIKTIYVVCPGYIATGGPEVLHQLVYHINAIGVDAKMVYIRHGDLPLKINEKYNKYIKEFYYLSDIEDRDDNALIVPETWINYLSEFSRIKTVIWWLSVDNFLKNGSIPGSIKSRGFLRTIKRLRQIYLNQHYSLRADMYLYQSEYAASYLATMGIPKSRMFYLSDYIADDFLKHTTREKEDIIAYNPAKGAAFTTRLMSFITGFSIIPIRNMSECEVIDCLSRAKVYIDFGEHPGKDRLPREAAALDCCVITGRRGSAAFYDDVSIPDEFKFDEDNVDGIIECINKIMVNYNEEYIKFAEYRKRITGEKDVFIHQVSRLFAEGK